MLTKTEWYWKVIGGAIDTTYHKRGASQIPGGAEGATDASYAAIGWYQQWADTPDKPGTYYTLVDGPLTVNDAASPPRVEQVNTWQEWSEEKTRSAIRTKGEEQIRQYSNLEISRDRSKSAVTDQDDARYRAYLEALEAIPDGDQAALESFDTDLDAYNASDKDYAGTIVAQDVQTLQEDTVLIEAAGGDVSKGLLTTEERNRIKSRIAKNRDVADGLASGVDTAGDGAARQYVRLDGEGNATATFAVLQAYEWPAGTPRYLAYCVLSDIDEGIVPANVWLRIYESDGSPINGVPANQNWLPFAENADGTWSTPQIVNYDSLAKAAPTVQRCAVSYLGSSSEDEVTRQVSIIPPNTSGATVRWEGRNGSGSTARRRRGGR